MKKQWLILLSITVLLLIAVPLLWQQGQEEASETVESMLEEDEQSTVDEHEVSIDEKESGNTVFAREDKQENGTNNLNSASNEEQDDPAGDSDSSSPSNPNESTDDREQNYVKETSSSKEDRQTDAPANNSTSNNNQSGANKASASSQETPAKTESVTSIKNRYFPEFQQLEFQQNGKLEALAQRAFDSYMDDRESFDPNRYRSEASALQAETDSAFYSLYSQMQAELKANGHSEHAGSEFEETYQAKKAAREQEFRELASAFQ